MSEKCCPGFNPRLPALFPSVLVNFKNLENDLNIVIEKWFYMLTEWRLCCHYCAV